MGVRVWESMGSPQVWEAPRGVIEGMLGLWGGQTGQ